MRLLSYNIHKGVGGRDRRYRLERVMDVIEGENPDLICLQEVVRKAPHYRSDDQPRLLAERFLPEGWLYQLNVHYRQGGYGNLLLSRWPIVAQHQISLRLNSRKPRATSLPRWKRPRAALGGEHPFGPNRARRDGRSPFVGASTATGICRSLCGRSAIGAAPSNMAVSWNADGSRSLIRRRNSGVSRPGCRSARSTRRFIGALWKCARRGSCATISPSAPATTCRW